MNKKIKDLLAMVIVGTCVGLFVSFIAYVILTIRI